MSATKADELTADQESEREIERKSEREMEQTIICHNLNFDSWKEPKDFPRRTLKSRPQK